MTPDDAQGRASPGRRQAKKDSTLSEAARPTQPSPRDRIVDAVMQLASEREWDDFGIADVAERAGVSLGEFRDAFPSKGAVLAAFSRRIDRVVLDGTSAALAEEAPRERLFDVLMRRLDALAPHRLALQGIADAIRKDPLSAIALNGVALNSMRFMLVAAGIDLQGPTSGIKLQGLAFAWTRVLDTWFDDGDPGLAKTMAALDRELSRGEAWVARVDDMDRLAAPLRMVGRALADAGRRRRDTNARPAPAADDERVV